jgi:hypothetical protein
MFAERGYEPISCVIDPSNKLGGIYLGTIEGAKDIELLKKLGISAVLTCASGTGLKYSQDSI